MGDSKVIKKFQQVLEQCKKEDFIRGKINDFDTLDYVPKERHLKGMIVESKDGTHRVDFYNDTKKYTEDASSLRIGDDIIVLRKTHPHTPTIILPAVIIVSAEKLILLSREQEIYRSEGWAENSQIVCFLITILLGIISWLSNNIPIILFNTLFMYWTVTLWFGLASILFMFLAVTIIFYECRARRGIVVRCDPLTWERVSTMLFQRLGLTTESSQ